MKNKLIRISGVMSTIFMVFMANGWSFFNMVVRVKENKRQSKKKWFRLSHTKINHPRYKFEKEYEDGKAWCAGQNMKDCYIKSKDGLKLHAYYLPAVDAKRFVILCHGYKGSGFGDFAHTARFLHENNCSLLFIDERCCGKSQGKYITFGAREKFDIAGWAHYVDRHNKNRLPIYLYGESLGAASVLMASGLELPARVKGLISDCGFASMKGQIKDMAKNWFHLKYIGLFLFRLNLFCMICAGFRTRDADTGLALMKNKRPVLFFHGMMDTYVDPKNTYHNYVICRAEKELVMVPDARHLCSPYEAEGMYRNKLLGFFEKYD